MKKIEKSKYAVALTFENRNISSTTSVHIITVLDPSEDEEINRKIAVAETLKRDSIDKIKDGHRLVGHAALYIEPW